MKTIRKRMKLDSRRKYSIKSVRKTELYKSIKKQGQMTATNGNSVLDGWARVLILKDLGRKTVVIP